MKRIVCLLLIAAMLAALSACGTPSLEGTWKGTVDIKDHFTGESALEGLIDSLPLTVTLELRDDGTYDFIVDSSQAVEELKDAVHRLLDEHADFLGSAAASSADELIEKMVAKMDLDNLLRISQGSYSFDGEMLYLDSGSEAKVVGTYNKDKGTVAMPLEPFGIIVFSR